VKETDVRNLNAVRGQGARADNVVLLDCGRASKVTKGFPFFLLFEFGSAPYDRLLL